MAILDDIINWVENKPSFWQIAIDRLIRNNKLNSTDIAELKNICKVDFGLSKFKFNSVNFVVLRKFANNKITNKDIIISKICNIDNINALSKTSELKFEPKGITIVYGDNGSGKSSYVSILKHACNTRGNKPKINDNLYDPSSFGKDKKADVEYTIDGTNFNTVKLLNGEVNNSVLKSVDVFDTFSANHYIEGEDEIAFIPHGLSILNKLALGIKKVETELKLELSTLNVAKFDYSIIDVSDCSTAKTFLNKLNSETTLNELKAEATCNPTSNLKIDELTKKIDDLKATDPKKNLKQNEEKIKRFEILQNKFQILENKLTGEVLLDHKKTLNNFITTSNALKKSSENAFSELPMEGVGNSSWKLLWESARKFYNESTETKNFPEVNENSNCPLCLQDLDKDAKNRFTSFESFIKNDIQKTYNEALSQFSLLIKSLNILVFSFEDLQPTTIELEELYDGYSEKQTQYLKLLSEQKDYLINLSDANKIVEIIDEIKIENTPKKLIIEIIKTLEKANKKLKTQSIEEDLKPLNKKLNQLIGEKNIFVSRFKLLKEIHRQRRVNELNKCLNKCKTNTITNLSNELTAKYINQNLKQNFKKELKKLGFKNIKIETETKGQKGKQYHYLRLDEPNTSNIALKDILSEGEHRCISFATFLSELSISEHKSAIVFDDPVSSLDHKKRNKIAERIAEESLNRQVIVFTHDITFLIMIQEHSKKMSCSLDIKSLTRKPQETGIVASNPPWDALNVSRRIGVLKSDQQKLQKIEKTETEESYKENAKNLYGKLRETWERFIEEVFLHNVIQRFGRAIQTQRLAKIVDLTDDDYKIVDENMSKCSTYLTGHDTSGALIEEIPDSDEFLADIKLLEAYVKIIRKRRN